VTRSIYTPSVHRDISSGRFISKDNRQRPFAGSWVEPVNDGDCPADPEWIPCLLNDWIQVDPGDEGLEPFGFRMHYDGSLEFKGHLDASDGAVSGTVALILPGMGDLEPDYVDLLDNSQYWDTVITDDAGISFQIALVKIDADTGEVTITWPAS
jgi:hypothetical protein